MSSKVDRKRYGELLDNLDYLRDSLSSNFFSLSRDYRIQVSDTLQDVTNRIKRLLGEERI